MAGLSQSPVVSRRDPPVDSSLMLSPSPVGRGIQESFPGAQPRDTASSRRVQVRDAKELILQSEEQAHMLAVKHREIGAATNADQTTQPAIESEDTAEVTTDPSLSRGQEYLVNYF
jgi:hypothetical protein